MKRKHRIALGAGAVLLGLGVIVPTSLALANLQPNNDTTTTASQSLEQPPGAPSGEEGIAAPGEAKAPVGPHAQNKNKDDKAPVPLKGKKAEQSRPDAKPLEESKIVKPSPKDVPRPSDLPPADNSNPGDDGTGRDGRTTTDETAPIAPLAQHLPSAS